MVSSRRSLMYRLVLSGATIALTLVTIPAEAQEVCGLQSVVYDMIFANGYQVPSGALGNALGTVPAPTLGVTPTITITYPAPSAQLTAKHTAVMGTFTGPNHTGLVVNGQAAYVFNSSFLVPDVQLESASPTLQVTATTLDELSANASVSVLLPAQAPLVRLDADAKVGLAPFNIDFLLSIDATLQVVSLTIDFGDSSSFNGTDPTAIPGHDYNTPGIYLASAAVITTTGSFNVERRVIVLDASQHRNRLCGVFAHLRSQLTAQDATRALQAFDPVVRPRYQDFFTAAGVAQLPTLATELGTLAAGLMGPDQAHMTIVKSAGGVVQGYPIEFAPDENGVWRITQL